MGDRLSNGPPGVGRQKIREFSAISPPPLNHFSPGRHCPEPPPVGLLNLSVVHPMIVFGKEFKGKWLDCFERRIGCLESRLVYLNRRLWCFERRIGYAEPWIQ